MKQKSYWESKRMTNFETNLKKNNVVKKFLKSMLSAWYDGEEDSK